MKKNLKKIMLAIFLTVNASAVYGMSSGEAVNASDYERRYLEEIKLFMTSKKSGYIGYMVGNRCLLDLIREICQKRGVGKKYFGERFSNLLTNDAIVKILHETEILPLNTDFLNETLHLALKENSPTDYVEILIKAGACVGSYRGDTPLHWAICQGNKKNVRVLIKAGADVNECDGFDISPLHVATSWGHKKILPILLGAGADVNQADRHGGTPLHWAAEKGHKECALILLQAGAIVPEDLKPRLREMGFQIN